MLVMATLGVVALCGAATSLQTAASRRFASQAALILAQMPAEVVGPAIPESRLEDCVNVILSYQNRCASLSVGEVHAGRAFRVL